MITLRTYFDEIENFIDQNLLDQVVAHSTHILKVFPNSYEAMRFLAQAYLEEKKYKESAAIFEKILTIVPDDFISHVGMSAIKEEQFDLDSAIFHMELAYDTQPSNVIVQDELKRLLEKRDGERPSKINLSRGSLIRMYIKGDLHQQALNEISAAMIENPDRLDLLVLKALVFGNSNDKVRAAETCNQIVEKFPYCLEANRILFEIFTEKGLKNQSSQVLDRLATINPYYKYVNNSTIKVEDVPDSKIELEKLDYTSAFSAGFQDFFSPPLKDAPLHSTIDNIPNEKVIVGDKLPENIGPDAQIPDFLSSAGWEKSDNPNNDPPEPVDYSDSEYSGEPQKNSELPEWLKNFQPSSNFIEDSPLSFPSNDKPVSIIDENDSIDEVISNIEETPKEFTSSLSEVAMTTDNPENSAQKDDSSDWMSQFFEEANKSVSEPEEEKSLPDWLKTIDQQDSISENSPDDEVPDWLKNLDSQIITNTQDEKPTPAIDTPYISEEIIPPIEEVTQQIDFSERKDQEDNIQTKSDELIFSNEALEEPSLSLDDLLSTSSFSESGSNVNQGTEGTKYELESNDNNESGLPDWVKSVLSSPEEVISPASDEQNQVVESQPITEKITLVQEDETTVTSTAEPIAEQKSEMNEGAISKETGEELLQWLSEVSTDKTERPDLTIDDFSRPDLEPIINIQSSEESVLAPNVNPEGIPEIDQFTDESIGSSKPEEAFQTSEIDQKEVVPSFDAFSQSEPEKTSTTGVTLDEELPSITGIGTENLPVKEGITTENSEITDTEVSEIITTPSSGVVNAEIPVEQTISENFEQLLSNDDYQEARLLFSSMNAAGFDNEKILEIITSVDEGKFNNFEFLQFLGDSLAEFNHFEQAMEIYTKAENLLTGK